MAKTELFVRKQKGGMFCMADETKDWGDIWFVDSTATSTGADSVGYGQNPDAPFLTLVYAETQAGTGDTIYVMPGHTETLTGNPSLTLDIAGLKVKGLGGWSRRPTLLIDGAATAHILLSGADTTFENFVLKAGDADVAKAIQVKADGVVVRNCLFKENTAEENFLICVNVGVADNDSDGVLIENNVMYQPDAASTHAVWFVKNQNHCTVRRNVIQGDYVADSAIIGSPGTENFLNLCVTDNLIDNDAGDSVHVIEFAGTNTGIVARNLSGDVDADGTPFIFTGGTLCENYHTGAVTTSGFLYPAADS